MATPIVEIDAFDKHGADIKIKVFANGHVEGLYGLNRVSTYIRVAMLEAVDGDESACARILQRYVPDGQTLI